MSKWPKTVDDLQANYLILYEKSTYVEGDERSRMIAGHGYPAHTEMSWEIEQFDSRAEWEQEIARLESKAFPNRKWKALVCDHPKIRTKIEVIIE